MVFLYLHVVQIIINKIFTKRSSEMFCKMEHGEVTYYKTV